MKNGLKSAVLSFALLALATVGRADTARLQVIHNAADPAAASVDIYVNGDLLLNDFAFREATSYMDVPADVELEIGVAPGNSGSAEDIIATFPVTLPEDGTFVALASGVLSPGDFAANPEGMDITFSLYPFGGRESGPWWAVKLNAFHGASDAPAVQVTREGFFGPRSVFGNLSFGENSGYETLFPRRYELTLRPAGDDETALAVYEADLRGLGGGAAVVFASGFLSPADNQDGEAFGLFVALPDGSVLELPAQGDPTARLQVVHNAADPAAASVDIYVNGELFQDDFAFRAATPFVDVPAGVELNIGVAPGTSGSADDIIASFPVTLVAGGSYTAVANGVLSPSEFATNPDGADIGFTLLAADGTFEQGVLHFIRARALHGASDAPAVDIRLRGNFGSRSLFSGLGYGEFSQYRYLLPRENLVIEVLPAGSETVVATFGADLSGLAGGAALIFASGFLDPAANQGGMPFGLFAALPDGSVVELGSITPMARLQVIHNAADPAAASVDIYVNGDLFRNDFAFRDATAFVDVPAGVELSIGVAPGTSGSAEDVIATFPVTLDPAQTYVVMAGGVLSPDDFASNPDGMGIGFSLYPAAGVRESAPAHLVRLQAFHGATDAPTVDVRWRPFANLSFPLFSSLSYGEFSSARLLPARSYRLEVTPAGDPSTVVAAYSADVSGLAGGAAVVFASGFLSPADNQNGAGFGLYAALADGTVIALPIADQPLFFEGENPAPARAALNQNYPNPFNPKTTIAFTLPRSEQVDLRVFDLQGRQVRRLLNGRMEAGDHRIDVDMSDVASGIYLYRIKAGSFVETRRMTLLK